MENLFKIIKKLNPILKEIINNGSVPYLVGGSVRDLVLNLETKDLDIEVHKISIKDLEKILKKFGHVRLVGQKFGVLKIDGINVDWSLPRKDSIGRKPKVIIKKDISIKDALVRRDLTINAMAIDLRELLKNKNNFKKIIIDPFGGLKDIKNKKLRVIDANFFVQDPLRLFRVMQFAARFNMAPDKNLNNICKTMSLQDPATGKLISRERIFDEIKKLLLKSKQPSIGFRWLLKINRLKDIFPEIYNLIGVKQKKEYHPEGDVFEHTMQCIDVAANLDIYETENEKFLIILALLCHDFGKPKVTDKNLSAIGHEKEGVEIAKKFLKRITRDKNLINSVCKLVLYHMQPAQLLKSNAKISAYKRLAIKLATDINMKQLGIVWLADNLGRVAYRSGRRFDTPRVVRHSARTGSLKKHAVQALSSRARTRDLENKIISEFKQYLKIIKNLNIETGPEKPILLGRDILDKVKPGPQMGKILKCAYKIQIEEGVKDKETLKKRVLK
ncbi:MAG: Polynucleotide adenylyltransferase region [candidate division TM6 bacterium GW2011_GWF2_28_16]|nr:MAG: Polynucleotide adenylyltransferase region [candidate division TM6 bacterium GW2011_GWF2_28_16]